jgi:transposase InsO family protein
MIAKSLRRWLGRVGVKAVYIEPGSPWEHGNCESFKGKRRNELLDGFNADVKLTCVAEVKVTHLDAMASLGLVSTSPRSR